MKINFSAMTDEERTTAFSEMDNDAIDASLTEARAEATALFNLDAPTIEQVNEAEALVAAIGHIETEQTSRAAAVTDAAARFAAARASFSAEPEIEDEEEEPAFSAEEDGAEEDEAEEDEAEESEVEESEAEGGEAAPVTTASSVNHTTSQRVRPSAARKVGQKTKRPSAQSSMVTISAAADVQGFSNGQTLNGMGDVTKAVQARTRGFAPFNSRAAERVRAESGGQPVLHKFGAASFSVPNANGLKVNSGADAEYSAVSEAVKEHAERVSARLGHRGQAAMSAAMAWCSPSEVVYDWIADYKVDGLLDLPEIAAPRGGLLLTEGPQLAQTTYAGDDVDDFGFGGTEAEMEAGYVKTCETIECPDFVDHRLDFDGYCWKVPILTEKTYPELVKDALRLTDVLYAHKMNRRFISDVIASSTSVDATTAFGGSQVDTLEALTQVAIKERRWWNLGSNAVMEVKLPQEALDIFKFDMARRSGLALNDIATEQKVAAHFANHNLAVTYLSDFDQRHGSAAATPNWPNTLRAIIYPVGAFVKAQDDVINLSAVYDAASLSANEYTGVFYEQGVKTIKRGYRSHIVSIPVCTSGSTGANAFLCDEFFDGSF